jgi:hypothetical protein
VVSQAAAGKDVVQKAHGVVLAAASAFFRAALSHRWTSPSTATTSSTAFQVTPEEAKVLPALLDAVYAAPEALADLTLLELMVAHRLARRWLLTDLLDELAEPIAQALANEPDHALTMLASDQWDEEDDANLLEPALQLALSRLRQLLGDAASTPAAVVLRLASHLLTHPDAITMLPLGWPSPCDEGERGEGGPTLSWSPAMWALRLLATWLAAGRASQPDAVCELVTAALGPEARDALQWLDPGLAELFRGLPLPDDPGKSLPLRCPEWRLATRLCCAPLRIAQTALWDNPTLVLADGRFHRRPLPADRCMGTSICRHFCAPAEPGGLAWQWLVCPGDDAVLAMAQRMLAAGVDDFLFVATLSPWEVPDALRAEAGLLPAPMVWAAPAKEDTGAWRQLQLQGNWSVTSRCICPAAPWLFVLCEHTVQRWCMDASQGCLRLMEETPKPDRLESLACACLDPVSGDLFLLGEGPEEGRYQTPFAKRAGQEAWHRLPPLPDRLQEVSMTAMPGGAWLVVVGAGLSCSRVLAIATHQPKEWALLVPPHFSCAIPRELIGVAGCCPVLVADIPPPRPARRQDGAVAVALFPLLETPAGVPVLGPCLAHVKLRDG